jgi:hypothetical protein
VVITWKLDEGKESYDDQVIDVVCSVRNELNGLRHLYEPVVYTENKDGARGIPYMPRPFPKGKWKILAILPKTNGYEAPEFISTDACQLVEKWTVVNGRYGAPTGEMVMDYGYGQHNSTSSTTLGCGRILLSSDRAKLTAILKPKLAAGEVCYLEVV